MRSHRIQGPPATTVDFDALRRELELRTEWPDDVLAEVDALGPEPPDRGLATDQRDDATDLELVTIDPPGSRDLDQAVAVEVRPAGGWRVRYAIADVAAWVVPGGAIDTEARLRTQTHYAPDGRTALHPPRLGEDLGSLLPDGPRPAVLWTIDVDGDGETDGIDLRRAVVRSRAQLTYPQVQADIDAGRAHRSLAALPALGEALIGAARRRGAIELGLADQEVVAAPDGTWTVELRAELPVEHWNAEVSLLTGRAAATIMLAGGAGLLRTVPAADPETFPRLRRAARSLGLAWPDGAHPGDVLATLDTSRPKDAAFADLAAELLRGAGYTPFQGAPPADPGHAGVGAPYAHVTAPLRRLVDRFATEICLALHAGRPVPAWALDALDGLPEAMADGDRRARALDRAVVDATEAFILADRVGETFAADVIETGERFGTVVLHEPPVHARCDGRDLPLGEQIRVRCTEADVARRLVRFERAS